MAKKIRVGILAAWIGGICIIVAAIITGLLQKSTTNNINKPRDRNENNEVVKKDSSEGSGSAKKDKLDIVPGKNCIEKLTVIVFDNPRDKNSLSDVTISSIGGRSFNSKDTDGRGKREIIFNDGAAAATTIRIEKNNQKSDTTISICGSNKPPENLTLFLNH